jgi:gas vesicle protein
MAAETKKIVKGGFRATLALIVSVIALIVSIIAYNSAGKEENLRARMRDLQTSIENMKNESSKQIDKLRGDTASALENLSNTIKKKEE